MEIEGDQIWEALIAKILGLQIRREAEEECLE